MPPRRNIVKTGNAGNSSKASKQPAEPLKADGPPPLFPPGSKTPLNLLYENSQKKGWEKPDVQTVSRAHKCLPYRREAKKLTMSTATVPTRQFVHCRGDYPSQERQDGRKGLHQVRTSRVARQEHSPGGQALGRNIRPLSRELLCTVF